MKKYEMLITLGGGGVMIGAGIVMIILGKLLGVFVMLAGLGLMACGYVRLMKGSGFYPWQGTTNGLDGKGKQQSEVIKDNQPVMGEQDATIWEKIEK